MTLKYRCRTAAMALIVAMAATGGWAGAAAPVVGLAPRGVILADGGQAKLPIVVATGATERVRVAATNLMEYLGKITASSFAVEEGDGQYGLVVGVPESFDKLPVTPNFYPDLATGREDYLLKSFSKGVYLLGSTELAVEHAVWDFLYRLGYRQFFPGDKWEIIPSISRLKVAIDTLQRPTFNSRTMSSATSGGVDSFGDREAYRGWMQRNRIADGSSKSGGHIYGFIIRSRKEEFEKHPEYRALVDGKRQGSKFCVSNPDLRQLVVKYALERLEASPASDAISMEPSDGGGFCECPECAKIGTITDQVVLLANQVAEAVSQAYPDKHVTILAYNFHTAPPNIRLHPKVAVTICAGQLTGNWEPNELFEAWAARGANSDGIGFGVFEYYSNIVGNRFLPGGPRASRISYLRDSITGFYERGARRLRSGAAYSNGTLSLGIYMASRMLWDLKESERLDELYDEFVSMCFGEAAVPMDRFLRMIYHFDGQPPLMPLTGDTAGRMYRELGEALALAKDESVRERILDYILYTRYVELYLASTIASREREAEAYGDLMRHAWRIRRTMMVNVYGLMTYTPKAYPGETYGWRVPAGKNPWKVGEDYDYDEITAVLAAGIDNNPIGEYTLRPFSENLVPAAEALGFEDKPLGSHGFGLPPGGLQKFYTWVDKAPGEVRLKVAGGFIWPKRSTNVAITLYSDKAVSDAADFVVTTDNSVPPDQQEYEVVMRTPYSGLHRIEVDGGAGSTRVETGSSNMAFTVKSGPYRGFKRRHTWEGWFYIPKNTEKLSFYVSHASGNLFDGDGNVVFSFRREWTRADGTVSPPAVSTGFHTVDVPKGQDGRLWNLRDTRSDWLLLNVPPYFARRPFELLLPVEVVEADSRP